MTQPMHKMSLDRIPGAKANGVRWLIASGASNEREALALAKRFICSIEEARAEADLENPSSPADE